MAVFIKNPKMSIFKSPTPVNYPFNCGRRRGIQTKMDLNLAVDYLHMPPFWAGVGAHTFDQETQVQPASGL